MSAPVTVDANGALHDRSGRFTHAWLYETGPLPYVDRPSATELPPPPPPSVQRKANGAVLISDNPDVPNRHRVRVDRDPRGGFRVVYLDGLR